jgi:hypothetical protein
MNSQTEHADHGPDPLNSLLAEARWAEPRPETIRRLQQHWQLLRANREWMFAPVRKTKTTRRAALLVAAGAVLACVWLGISYLHAPGVDAVAFAETLGQIEKAKTMTWTSVAYEHVTGKDGKKTWLRKTYDQGCYKAPGLHRTVWLDDNGQPEQVTITDTIHGRELVYLPKEKKAYLEEKRPWPNDPGPFPAERSELAKSSLQWIGKRKTPNGEANVFRYAHRDYANDRDWSTDYWIDVKTKQLVAFYSPGADIYDPDKDPLRDNPPDKKWHQRHVMGGGWLDMHYGPALDDSLFRLEPPEGYTLEISHYAVASEKEMIDFLRVVAEFNDKTFPDQPSSTTNFLDKVNKALKKESKDQTRRGSNQGNTFRPS